MQQSDFEALYEAMEGDPVTIRFLDPPLHEFVPTTQEEIRLLAKTEGKTIKQVKEIIDGLKEFNPMMGHRGCRLAVTYPEIAAMQTRAVIRAALNVQARHPDWTLVPEIMIPLVGEVKELKYVKDVVVKTADEEIKAAGTDLKYKVGTMIEIPRAALTADQIAKEAEFFSFGTNDLTQMTFGFSRDDAGKFLGSYYDKKIYENDPFAKLDQTGVGKLVEMAVKLGHATRPDIHMGICGEHGGEPTSVAFCHRVGLDYVSCSPFRVPIARLAAAQAGGSPRCQGAGGREGGRRQGRPEGGGGSADLPGGRGHRRIEGSGFRRLQEPAGGLGGSQEDLRRDEEQIMASAKDFPDLIREGDPLLGHSYRHPYGGAYYLLLFPDWPEGYRRDVQAAVYLEDKERGEHRRVVSETLSEAIRKDYWREIDWANAHPMTDGPSMERFERDLSRCPLSYPTAWRVWRSSRTGLPAWRTAPI